MMNSRYGLYGLTPGMASSAYPGALEPRKGNLRSASVLP